MENLDCNIETVYFRHIGKQLLKNLFTEARFQMYLKKLCHPDKEHNYNDIFEGDDLYMRILSRLAEKSIDYYLKNLEIFIDERNYEVADLKYDYYNPNEIVIKANIKFNVV